LRLLLTPTIEIQTIFNDLLNAAAGEEACASQEAFNAFIQVILLLLFINSFL
jgi:hypothetical protein